MSLSTLGEYLFGKNEEDLYIWQDRELRFDCMPKDIVCRPGEEVIQQLDGVEDTKGNPGEDGLFLLTNLRLIWMLGRDKRTNLSIGLDTIQNISIKSTESRLTGAVRTMSILTKFNQSKFEFIFAASAAPPAPGTLSNRENVFAALQAVHRSYESTRLYRDLRLRGSIIAGGELMTLAQEQIYSKVNGVWNLSSEHGNLGTFFVTNVRVVWFANLAENFNVSVPYLQMKSVRVRDSKFGRALVIETTERSGGYILGFKIDPAETLEYARKEIRSLFDVYSRKPVFGVEYTAGVESGLAALRLDEMESDVQIVDDERGGHVASYLADPQRSGDKAPVYCPQLGLAIESLKDGITLDQLWSIL